MKPQGIDMDNQGLNDDNNDHQMDNHEDFGNMHEAMEQQQAFFMQQMGLNPNMTQDDMMARLDQQQLQQKKLQFGN